MRSRAIRYPSEFLPAQHPLPHRLQIQHTVGKALAHQLLRHIFIVLFKHRHFPRVHQLQGVEILERRLSLRVPQEPIFTITRFLQKAMP